jgi:hypothetical protein
MTVRDLSRRLSPGAIRRLANRYRRQIVGGVSLAAAAAATVMFAVPALAHDGAKKPLPACSSTLPLTTPCAATVTPPAAPGGNYTVTLPGIGTLNITVDPATNQVTAATVSGLNAGFTASTPKIDADKDSVKVTFTSTTDPNQVYRLKVSVKAPATAGGTPTVTAKVKGAHKDGAKHHDSRERGESGQHGDHHD